MTTTNPPAGGDPRSPARRLPVPPTYAIVEHRGRPYLLPSSSASIHTLVGRDVSAVTA